MTPDQIEARNRAHYARNVEYDTAIREQIAANEVALKAVHERFGDLAGRNRCDAGKWSQTDIAKKILGGEG